MKPIDYQDFVLIKDFEHGQLDIALKFREAVFGDDLNALISSNYKRPSKLQFNPKSLETTLEGVAMLVKLLNDQGCS